MLWSASFYSGASIFQPNHAQYFNKSEKIVLFRVSSCWWIKSQQIKQNVNWLGCFRGDVDFLCSGGLSVHQRNLPVQEFLHPGYSYVQGFLHSGVLTLSVLHLGVLTSRSFTLRRNYIQRFLLHPEVLTSRSSYVHGFLHSGVITSRGYYTHGFLGSEVLTSRVA